ncbi:MAG TPA: sulfurtransferase [Rudaea sp.]|nr:sulfurtransferase [Rudaea sp.]
MNRQTLIDARALNDLARTDDILIVDCRFSLADPDGGARDYAQGHIPGAVYADLNRDLSDLSRLGAGRHPLPDAWAFSALLGRLGWKPGMQVVAYDAANGAIAAARLWWMLRLVGERNVAVLDGGLKAWTDAGFGLSAESVHRRATLVSVQFDAGQIVDSAQLEHLLKNPAVLLIDARAAERFRGDVEPLDPVAGHVPRARNRPFSENLDADGRFKPARQLRDEFQAVLGDHAADDTVHMCGSGVTACHNLLAMEHAGLVGSRIFAPSWSGWIADASRPVARGPS